MDSLATEPLSLESEHNADDIGTEGAHQRRTTSLEFKDHIFSTSILTIPDLPCLIARPMSFTLKKSVIRIILGVCEGYISKIWIQVCYSVFL